MLNQAGVNYSVADKGERSNLNRSLKEMLDGSKCWDSCGGSRESRTHMVSSAALQEQPLPTTGTRCSRRTPPCKNSYKEFIQVKQSEAKLNFTGVIVFRLFSDLQLEARWVNNYSAQQKLLLSHASKPAGIKSPIPKHNCRQWLVSVQKN